MCILRWRLQIRKALATPEVKEETKEGVSKVAEADDEGVLAQMEEMKEIMELKKKRQRKLVAKRKAKVWNASRVEPCPALCHAVEQIDGSFQRGASMM